LKSATARLEERARDWLATNPAAKRSPQHPQIAYLGIDDASTSLDAVFSDDLEKSPALRLMKEGFPWNREVYGHVLDRLFAAGARSVVLDMLFPAPRDGDEAFRAALDRHAARVTFGSNLKEADDEADTDRTTENNKGRHIGAARTLITPGERSDPRLGFVNVRAEPDGIVRRAHYRTTALHYFNPNAPSDGEELLSLAARALEKAGHAALVPRTHEPVRFRFCEEILPRSLHEIFVEDQWANPPYNGGAFFKDKIVLIGAAGNESTDRLQTPFGTSLGPAIHLSAINAALHGDFLRETSRAVNLALIGGGGLLAWLLGAFIDRRFTRLVLLAGALAGSVGLAQVLFNQAGFYPILLSPLLALAGSGITWSVWEQVIDRREKQKLRRTLDRYVSKDVVKELVDNPQSFLNTLGGVRKEITVLFSDVRGFTSLTEAAEDPQLLVKQLNEYFNEMVRIVFANSGTLDKFIGDAVMAHWGSIIGEGASIDACRAVTTAVQMRKALARLNPGWKARGMLELHFGIGINHGDAVVGNLGAEEKMEVSVIGDAVNLASRLEGVTKPYHVDLCIGEKVAALVREKFILRSLDLIVVKGKTKPVEVFTVLDERDAASIEPPWLASHEEAMRLYRKGEFARAASNWRQVLEQAPEDGVAQLFLERCAELQANPPEGEWTGAFEMKSK
jgi:adenylate cyclase